MRLQQFLNDIQLLYMCDFMELLPVIFRNQLQNGSIGLYSVSWKYLYLKISIIPMKSILFFGKTDLSDSDNFEII